MSTTIEGEQLDAIVLDLDRTLYSLTDADEEKIWNEIRHSLYDSIKENQPQITFDHFVEEAKQESWRTTFLKYGGTEDRFKECISQASIAEHLCFSDDLVCFLDKLTQYLPV